MIVRTISLALTLLHLPHSSKAFSPVRPWRPSDDGNPRRTPRMTAQPAALPRCRDTTLAALVDVPYGFFTLSLPVMGVILSISRHVSRTRLEERAWEQRLAAAQKEMLEQTAADSNAAATTELDVRRQYAAMEWSAYGGERTSPAAAGSTSKATTTTTVEPPYDPYYDEPYPEDELPEDRPYTVDRVYGDRVYEDGEIFYKDSDTGMYYRQGCKPRGVRFFP